MLLIKPPMLLVRTSCLSPASIQSPLVSEPPPEPCRICLLIFSPVIVSSFFDKTLIDEEVVEEVVVKPLRVERPPCSLDDYHCIKLGDKVTILLSTDEHIFGDYLKYLAR